MTAKNFEANETLKNGFTAKPRAVQSADQAANANHHLEFLRVGGNPTAAHVRNK